MDEQEAQEVMQIATDYFLQETGGDQAKADEMLRTLAGIIQEPGAKLVHLGNIVFLVMVRGKGVVEIHTMAVTLEPDEMVDALNKLLAYLKNIGVKTAMSYADNARFRRITRKTKFPIKETKGMVNGKEMYIYIAEL